MNGEWGTFYTGGWYASNKRVRKRSNLSISCSNLVFLYLLFYLFLDSDYIFISELLIPSIKHPYIFPSVFLRLLSPFSWTLIYLRMIKIYRTRQPFDFLAALLVQAPLLVRRCQGTTAQAMLFESRIGLAILMGCEQVRLTVKETQGYNSAVGLLDSLFFVWVMVVTCISIHGGEW